MKKLLIFVLFLPLFSKAQVIEAQPSSLNFGNVNVGQKDSLQITLTNRSLQSINVTGIKNYLIYGNNPFTVSQSSFSLQAGGSQTIWVYFEPEHNILNNSELVVQHNATSGFTAIDVRGQGQFPITYYNSTQNLEEEALKTALRTRLAQGYRSLSYNAARDNMYATIDNNNGQVECAYTGRRATFSTRSGANSNSFNCEHTFPQGFFNSNNPMRSDIHHLFPTDVTANSRRGNFPFGTVSGSGTWSSGGSKLGGGVFEPRNVQKGRTARAMMYFVIRYQDYSNHFSVQESILRNWHNQYQVTQAEQQRNIDINFVQGNRNPFVDYPQLEERITNFVSNSVKQTQFGLDVLQTAVNFGNYNPNVADTFNYVLVNTGNQAIVFSNASVSNNSLLGFAANSGNNRTVQPGEALSYSIVVQGGNGNLNENLTFNTNIPGSRSSFTIPIRGNAISTDLSEIKAAELVQFYPNPVKDYLNVEIPIDGIKELRILDAMGKVVYEEYLNGFKGIKTIETSTFSKGVYFVELSTGEDRTVRKIVK